MKQRFFIALLALVASPALAADLALELRGEARIMGDEVRLAQVCRWDRENPDIPANFGSLSVATVGREKFKSVTADDVETALRKAGISPAMVELSGARRCLVNRLDVQYDEAEALSDWASVMAEPAPSAPGGVTLGDLLANDLRRRSGGGGGESLNITFDADAKLLALPEEHFAFEIMPRKSAAIGRVSWDVAVEQGGVREVHVVQADVTQTVETLVLTRPIPADAVIPASAVEKRLTTIDRQPRSPLATLEDLHDAATERALEPGTVVTSRHLRPLPIVRRGQFITVKVGRGSVSVKTVARAMEDGARGQMIRVRDEATRNTYTALVTGPSEAALGDAALDASVATASH